MVAMDFIDDVDPVSLENSCILAESDQFCIYALDKDTYLLVQRHEGTPWTGLRISGDGLFRIGLLVGEATRNLYRHLAERLSLK
jgi:hypothetical protein